MKTVIVFSLLLFSNFLSVKAEALSPPDGLAPGDWSSIRAAHEAWRHAFRPAGDGSFSASNPGQGWSMAFDGAGFTVKPREGDWTWGLELEAPVSGPASAEGQRLSIPRGEGLEEWFINDSRGLEQGWTLYRRPEGDEGTLRLSMRVRGGLEPVAAGRSVSFGGGVLSYGGLKAWDATGRDLEAIFSVEEGRLVVEVEAAGAVYPVTVDPVAQQAYLKASNAGEYDEFGAAIATEGETVVVGAPYESGNGIDGPGDDSMSAAGAVYVFVRDGSGNWTQQSYLKASNPGLDDRFGGSVAISGGLIAVGADGEDGDGVHGPLNNSVENSGAVYTFRSFSGGWAQQSYIKASNPDVNDSFGTSGSLSGGTLVVGAPGERGDGVGGQGNNDLVSAGAAYVFEFDSGTTWVQTAYLKDTVPGLNELFGTSVAIEGDLIVCGVPRKDGQEGSATVFRRVGGAWSSESKLKASNAGSGDRFGEAIALSGNTVVIGARREDGNRVDGPGDDSAENAGAAYVFVRDGAGVWSQQAYLKASNAEADDEFGRSVAIDGEVVIVGASREDGDGASPANNLAIGAGAAYAFVRNSLGQWRQQAYLKASNAGIGDSFGFAVAVFDGTAVIGAIGEESDGSGEADNSFSGVGAAYVFTGLGPTQASLTLTRAKRFKTTRRGKRSRPQAIRAGNEGDLTATGLAVRLTGKGRRDFRFTRPPANLFPGRQAVIRITFRPRGEAMRRATLLVSSANAGVRRTPLSGRGIVLRRRR